MPVKKRWIKVKTEFRGIHSWSECPHEEASFLKYPHRHTFKVEVKVEVNHNDREIEFFCLQHDVDYAIQNILWGHDWEEGQVEPIDLGSMSCEMIAEDLYKYLCSRSGAPNDRSHIYKTREMVISVSEDGEVSAELEFEPEQ